jgi:hypothetical protein
VVKHVNIIHKWFKRKTFIILHKWLKDANSHHNKQFVESLKLSRLFTSGSKYQNYTQVVINVKIMYKWLKRLKMVKTV